VWPAGGTGAVQVFEKVLYLQWVGVGTSAKKVQKWFPIGKADWRRETADRSGNSVVVAGSPASRESVPVLVRYGGNYHAFDTKGERL